MDRQRKDDHAQPGTSQNAAKMACVACRAVKMRCRSLPNAPACDRCTRKSLHCEFRQQKRGRKPRRSAPEIGQTQLERPSTTFPISIGSEDVEVDRRQGYWGRAPIGLASEKRASANGVNSRTRTLAGLQPPNLLGRETTRGWFPEGNPLAARRRFTQERLETASDFCDGDPIQQGLVSHHVATSLFHGFMNSLNPLVCVLDPVFYAFHHVRQRSSFLLTVILAAAAKAFNPSLHPSLRNCAEELFLDSFRRGTKSVEVIQAILLFTYWKQADDTRSWATVGYAIRLAMELGWHKLSVKAAENSAQESELDVRKRRNVERTWLVLFIHDRGLQTGKPWMIEKSVFIESVYTWQESQYASSNDATLCALATLRLTTADIIEVLNPQRPSRLLSSGDQISPLLRTLKPQLDAWLEHWTTAVGDEICHKFLVNFYVNHVQLFLYSFPLQESLAVLTGGPVIDNNAFWIAYNSAIEMLKSISQPTVLSMLSFIHDAVHVMIAYAAVFLVKLLLSVHSGIRRNIESSVIEIIHSTAQALAAQEMPPTYSCFMQARFLGNLIRDYQHEKTCQPSARHIVSQQDTQSPNGPAGNLDDIGEIHEAQVTSPDLEVISGAASYQDNAILHVPPIQTRDNTHSFNYAQNPDTQGMVEAPPSNWNWMLTHDESWTAMLMQAGFDVEEGIFLPDYNTIR